MEHMSSANRIPCDHSDDRLRTGAYLLLKIEDVEAMDTLAICISSMSSDSLVSSRTESLFSLPCQNDDSDILIIARIVQGLHHLDHCERTEGIAHFRAIDRDLGDPFALVICDIRKRSCFFPYHLVFSIHCKMCCAHLTGFSRWTTCPALSTMRTEHMSVNVP